MTRNPTIAIPRPQADAPGRFPVGLSALAGLLGGLALALTLFPSAPEDPDREKGDRPGTEARGRAGVEGLAPAERAENGATDPVPPPDAKPAPDRASKEGLAGPALDRPEPDRSVSPPRNEGVAVATSIPDRVAVPDRVVTPGRTAYLRCDGVEPLPGPFPCPRDLELEQAVRQILGGLSDCSQADPGLGHSDVRLDFKRGEETIVRVVRSTRFEDTVNEKAVYDCVGELLTRVPTQLDPLYMVVSFQFELSKGS